MTKRQVLRLFDQYVCTFIFTDIERSIRAKTNFLTALGLMTYTEFIGGLISGNGGKSGNARLNFYEAYNRLGQEYVRFDQEIRSRFRNRKRKPRDFYDIVRCGLVHEYFVKKNFVIARRRRSHSAPGVCWEGRKIVIANRNYFHAFRRMCEQYREELVLYSQSRNRFAATFKRKTYLHP